MWTALLTVALSGIPAVGDIAPDFTVKDTDGVTLTLSALVERGPVVLAFFPKAFTGGCTRELAAYTERSAEIAKHRATVIAVSMDSQETQAKFKASLKAPYPFVADDDAKLTTLYDVKTPILPISKRVTFVIGPQRRVLSRQDGGDAIDPTNAVAACNLTAIESLKYVTGGDASVK